MISAILRRLSQPDPDPFEAYEARLAVAALLVRLARSDGDYAAIEIDQIDRILAARYGLAPDAAQALRSQAETLEADAPDTVRFTRAIKAAVPHEDRFGLLQSFWSLVLADGTRDEHEDSTMRVVANLLGINDRDSALARQKAAQ